MKIVVCVKQVPGAAEVGLKQDNTLKREGVESIMNPFDEYAVETAVRLKEVNPGTEITVMTMGPKQSAKALRKALAMGADSAILLTDKKFAGADTQATSRTLAAAIKKQIGDFDLILCGQFAIDGDTGQTGPSLAEHLNLPQVTYVNSVKVEQKDFIVATKQVEVGIYKVKMKLPGLICILKCEFEPRTPTIRGVLRAKKAAIEEINLEQLDLPPCYAGLTGSPTIVSKAFKLKRRRTVEVIHGSDLKETVHLLIDKLQNQQKII